MNIQRINIQNRQGFTLIEIMIVVLIIGILLSIAVPNFVKVRESTKNKACTENLHKIQWAKEQWAIESNQPASATPVVNDIAGSFKFLTELPDCPSGGTYALNSIATVPTCTVSGHAIE